jgi:hypothetical protein
MASRPDVPRVALIGVSGDAAWAESMDGEGDEETGAAALFDAFITKPVLLSALHAALQRCLPELVPRKRASTTYV